MNGLTGRLSGYLWLVSIIFLIISMFGYLYYLETERKEHYFDQLYFRQLDEVSRGFQNNLQRLRFFTEIQNRIAMNWNTQAETLQTSIAALRERTRSYQQEGTKSSGDDTADSRLEEINVSDTEAYDIFTEAGAELEYYSVASSTELENAFLDEVVELFEMFAFDKETTENYRRHFHCVDKPSDPSAEKLGIKKKEYCEVIDDLLPLLGKLDEFAGLELEQVSKFNVSEIDAVIASAQAMESTDDKLEQLITEYEDKLEKKLEYIMLLQELRPGEPQEQQTGKPAGGKSQLPVKKTAPKTQQQAPDPLLAYQHFRSEFLQYQEQLPESALRRRLTAFYANEDCSGNCPDRPADLDTLVGEELLALTKPTAILLTNYLMTTFIESIREEMQFLIDDTRALKSALVTLQEDIKTKGSSALEDKKKLLLELEQEKAKYFEKPAAVAKTAARHYLKLRYLPSQECPLTRINDDEDDYLKRCKSTLFISPANTLGGKDPIRLEVSSYLTEGHVFKAFLDDLLPEKVGQFNTLLIAAGDGSVLLERVSSDSIENHEFLNIKDILARAVKDEEMSASAAADVDKENEEENTTNLTHSTYVEQTIGGVKYRLYIYPHRVRGVGLHIDGKMLERPTLYFIGVKPLGELSAAKMKIAPSTSTVLFSIVLAILLAVIFLKIQLSHVDASFSKPDGIGAVFALIILAIVSTAGITTLGISDRFLQEMKEDAEHSIQILQKRFAAEVGAALTHMENLLQKDEFRKALTSTDSPGPYEYLSRIKIGERARFIDSGGDPDQDNANKGHLVFKVNREDYKSGDILAPLDNLFLLDKDGQLSGELIRGTRSLITSGSTPNLSGRLYFQRARDGDIWKFQANADTSAHYACADNGAYPLYLQRIFNIIDGALTTQFALPVRHQMTRSSSTQQKGCYYDMQIPAKKGAINPEVLSFGSTLLSFKTPILPAGMQFAVIDNESGQVLYHSEDNRSLEENFFQETENNYHLQAHIRVTSNIHHEAQSEDEKIQEFRGLYRGKDTLFFADRLHRDIPWTIIVYKHADDFQSIIALYFCISLLIAVAVVITTLVLVFVLRLQKRGWFNWIWPQPTRHTLYLQLTAGIWLAAFPLSYLIYSYMPSLLSLCLMIIALVVLFCFVLRAFFKADKFSEPEKTFSMKALRYRYVGFMMSVLALCVAAPTLVIAKKVGNDIFHRVTYYEEMQLNEARDLALQARHGQIERLCGKEAIEQGDTSGCNTIGRSLMDQLHQPTETIKTVACKNPGYRIFCRETSSPEHPDKETQFINPVLRWLNPFWNLPVLLESLSFTRQGAEPVVKINSTTEYHLSHRYPILPKLILGDGMLAFILGLSWLFIAAAIYFLAIKLLGIDVPRSYRTCRLKIDNENWIAFTRGKLKEQISSGPDYDDLLAALEGAKVHCGILIRPRLDRDKELIAAVRNPILLHHQHARPIDVRSLACDVDIRRDLEIRLEAVGDSQATLVIENFESIAFNKDLRTNILEFMENCRNKHGNISVVILSDVAPLYMLTNQSRYIPNTMAAEFADSQEIVRWARLLSGFKKYYDWSPMDLEFTESDKWENSVLHELSAWPELFTLKPVLDEIGSAAMSEPQIIQFVSTHAGPIYRRRWNFCTKEEKLLLYQLAKGLFINPANAEPLEHLMRRGFVRRDPYWKIANKSFARFVLTAEREQVYSKWVTASEQGLWKVLRIPLVTAALAILAILVFSAQEAIESFVALATSMLALLPLLLRNLSLVRSSSSPPPDS